MKMEAETEWCGYKSRNARQPPESRKRQGGMLPESQAEGGPADLDSRLLTSRTMRE